MKFQQGDKVEIIKTGERGIFINDPFPKVRLESGKEINVSDAPDLEKILINLEKSK